MRTGTGIFTDEPGLGVSRKMRKALIVDDEKKIRKIYKRFLTEEKFEVLEAENGEQASLMLVLQRDIALILLDIRMPVVDGTALFDIIKLQSPGAKVIVASVYPVDDQRRVITDADGYFDKSEGIDILLMRIKKVLSHTNGAGEEEDL